MPLSEYEIDVAGIPHTVQMDDDEAQEKGYKKVGEVTLAEPVEQSNTEKAEPSKPANKAKGKPDTKGDGDNTDA